MLDIIFGKKKKKKEHFQIIIFTAWIDLDREAIFKKCVHCEHLKVLDRYTICKLGMKIQIHLFEVTFINQIKSF